MTYLNQVLVIYFTIRECLKTI